MELQKFTRLREYLYHLTDESNLASILNDRTLKSTTKLAQLVNMSSKDTFLKTRRIGHKKISNGNTTFSIRDQDPLFQKIVEKNLEDGMSFGEFVYLLNSKVFFWATEKDLHTHYKRYENQEEYPTILRVKTLDLFEANQKEPKFCRLNSGAPRCSAYYPQGAPPRGKNTFLPADLYNNTPSSVREVTFETECILPEEFYITSHISKPFKRYR